MANMRVFYRINAADCRKKAREATNDRDAAWYLSVARRYDALARGN